MSNPIKKTSDVISEKPIWIKVGLLRVKIKPSTLSQIYEIGALLENIEPTALSGQIQPVVEMLNRYHDIALCNEVFIILAYRSQWKRTLFGNYIRKHLTMDSYKALLDFSAETFKATFFLISFTFLKGVKETTKSTNTEEAIALGDSLEE